MKRNLYAVIYGVIVLLLMTCQFSGLASVSVVNELSHSNIVMPGDIYRGNIVLLNSSDAVQRVNFTHTDYTYNSENRSSYDEPGTNPRSNASWIELETYQIDLQPYEQRSITYTVRVPRDESLVGSFWSLIMAESPGNFAGETAPAEGTTIVQVIRFGVRIDTHIGDTGERAIGVMSVNVIQTEESLEVRPAIANTGERYLKPYLTLEVYDDEGQFIGEFMPTAPEQSLHPGTSIGYLIHLPHLEPGIYSSLLYIDNLDEYIWGVPINIEISE